jgi:hypothetical protein
MTKNGAYWRDEPAMPAVFTGILRKKVYNIVVSGFAAH